jgi:hypothetical protein
LPFFRVKRRGPERRVRLGQRKTPGWMAHETSPEPARIGNARPQGVGQCRLRSRFDSGKCPGPNQKRDPSANAGALIRSDRSVPWVAPRGPQRDPTLAAAYRDTGARSGKSPFFPRSIVTPAVETERSAKGESRQIEGTHEVGRRRFKERFDLALGSGQIGRDGKSPPPTPTGSGTG